MTTQHILSVQVLNDYIEENTLLGGYKVRNAAGIAHVYRVADPTVRALALEAWQVHIAPVDIACACARYYPQRAVVAALLDCVEQTAPSLRFLVESTPPPPPPPPRRRRRQQVMGEVRTVAQNTELEERCRALRAQVRAWALSAARAPTEVERALDAIEPPRLAIGKESDNAILAHTYLGRICSLAPPMEALENAVHIVASAVSHAMVARCERTSAQGDPNVALSDLLRAHFPTPSPEAQPSPLRP